MTLVVRLLTLLTIAAAGFALPITCAQGGVTAAAEPVAIEIPAVQQLATSPADLTHMNEAQKTVATLADRALDQGPFDCGQTAPIVTDHSAVFDTQPFVPGYLGTAFLLDEDQSDTFAPPAELVPVESRAGPPDAPPPKPIG
ncbi:MAG TPA: hypothetical protein VFP05_14450 [Thermomicrobiales bacterium]|nr:hypothetical protein [Thermomicrobiales bacterium]